MLLAEITCETCGTKLTSFKARSYREVCAGLPAALIACHAAMPHCPHRLSFRLKGEPRQHELEEVDDLIIRCLSPACQKEGVYRTRAPLELVSAVVLVFHTSHEGHPIEVRYRDACWTSPR